MANANDSEPTRPTREAITKRAYELYLQRGSVPGYELDDWLQAEAELTAAAATAHDESDEPGSDDPDPREPRRPGGPGRTEGRRPASRERGVHRRSLRS
jgi:hypothetical protein